MEETKRPKARRLSLTKKQREAGAGLELLSLLLSVAGDGRLTAEEVAGLRAWLQENAEADLPAIGFLRQVVDQVLADGQVTEAESDEVWDAVLRVLPPEDREVAKSARYRMVEERVRASREAFRAKIVEEQAAAGLWDFMVAGVSHGNRAFVIEDQLAPGDPVQLIREPDNAFDGNAIHIRTEGGDSIGYVPAVLARRMAPILDAGLAWEAVCKKILTGNTLPIPVVVVSFGGVPLEASIPLAQPRAGRGGGAEPGVSNEAAEEATSHGPTAAGIAGVVLLIIAALIWLGVAVLRSRR